MEVERAIAIEVDAERLLDVVGRRRRESFRPLVEEVLGRLPSLLEPVALWTVTDLEGLDGTVRLVDERGRRGRLSLGERRELLRGASQVVLALSTIGPALERSVAALIDDDPLRATVLDAAGTLALGEVSAWLRGRIEEEARSRGWGTGPALLPGSLQGWPVEGQREIAAFLDLDAAAMTLTDRAVLRPHKSVSVAVGIGPGYDEARVRSLCGDCPRRESCQWRKA